MGKVLSTDRKSSKGLSRKETERLTTFSKAWVDLMENRKNLKELKSTFNIESHKELLALKQKWEGLSKGLQVTGSALQKVGKGASFIPGIGQWGMMAKYAGSGVLATEAKLREFQPLFVSLRHLWNKEWCQKLSDLMNLVKILGANVEKWNSKRKRLEPIMRSKKRETAKHEIIIFLRSHLPSEYEFKDDVWISAIILGESARGGLSNGSLDSFNRAQGDIQELLQVVEKIRNFFEGIEKSLKINTDDIWNIVDDLDKLIGKTDSLIEMLEIFS